MTMTPARENERMLARLMGVSEDEAAAQLQRRVALTHNGGLSEDFAVELANQLSRTIQIAGDHEPCDLEIVIGNTPARNIDRRVYATLSSGVITLSKHAHLGSFVGELHPLQLLIGACYAAGFVLTQLIDGIQTGTRPDPFTICMDALGADGPLLQKEIRLESAALIGAGAVGNGFLRAARCVNFSGTLFVSDPKVVGPGNPNRCLYFDDADVGSPKAERLCSKAQPHFSNLKLQPFVGTFSELVRREIRVRRAIVAADSRRARRSIQTELPVEVFDASTTDACEVIVHSHRQPTDGACLACIYRHVPDEHARERDIASGLGVDLQDVTSGNLIDQAVAAKIAAKHPSLLPTQLVGTAFDSLFKRMCAEQILLSSTGAQVLAPFAFISNLAGALLALELIRSKCPELERQNYLFLSPWAVPSNRRRTWRPKTASCEFCGRPETRKAFELLWPEVTWYTAILLSASVRSRLRHLGTQFALPDFPPQTAGIARTPGIQRGTFRRSSPYRKPSALLRADMPHVAVVIMRCRIRHLCASRCTCARNDTTSPPASC